MSDVTKKNIRKTIFSLSERKKLLEKAYTDLMLDAEDLLKKAFTENHRTQIKKFIQELRSSQPK